MKFIVLLTSLAALVIFGLQTTLVEAAPCTITVTNTSDSGAGSLRDAITNANSSLGSETICFSIAGDGVHTINLLTPLPPVVRPTEIDGTTQTGYSGTPLIELNGANADHPNPGLERGLYISGNGSGSSVSGLIINRFGAHGIFIDTSNVTVRASYIGLNSSGSLASANGDDGVGIFNGANNTIGGTTSSDRNIISGNLKNGIGITGVSATGNVVSGNYIGTNVSGTGAVANTGDGVLINFAPSNIVGGSTGTTPGGACTGACNLLSGNGANGIGIWNSTAVAQPTTVTSELNTVYGNYVGTDASGTASLPNANIGIEVNESSNNTIGGTTPEERNIFSGNGGAGVFITGVYSENNIVQGNYIGTNSTGTVGIGNAKMGLSIGPSPTANPQSAASKNNTIGGTVGTTPGGACTGACNLISGNTSNGILLSDSGSSGQKIYGNYIGTNALGTGPISNGLDGIGLLSVPNTSIGNGTSAGRNIISSNGSNGVIVVGGASTGNRIEGNFIGINTNGNGLGNAGSGVGISGATDTAILGNSIYSNTLMGIDLDNNGSTNLNDPGDKDYGANRLQNFPEIFAVKKQSVSPFYTNVSGLFNGQPLTSYRLEFFSSNACNGASPFNFGEGRYSLGTKVITTDIFGNSSYTYQHTSAITGIYVTSTATKMIGSVAAETSEFSRCAVINSSKPAYTNSTSGATWYLKNDLTTGSTEKQFNYGSPADMLMCAWNPNQKGVKLPVIVVNSTWFMRASYTTGTADHSFQYGFPRAKPVCGDWNGDGIETPGLSADGAGQKIWFLRNSNTTGVADITFGFGPTGTISVTGDWNGDDVDTIGLVSNLGGGGSRWMLRDSNSSGTIDHGSSSVGFDLNGNGHYVTGDWDSNGTDTPAIIGLGFQWHLRNSNSAGGWNGIFSYYPGQFGSVPIVW